MDTFPRAWSRRRVLGAAAGLIMGGTGRPVTAAGPRTGSKTNIAGGTAAGELTLFLCGDVMTGRGIDQVLPHPCVPRIFEDYMTSAAGYVELAKAVNGPIPKPVAFSYPWGDALAELERRRPALRIINLETSVTRSAEALPKGINYRMSPENFPCITAAGIDCCVLANNHVLDWGEKGLLDTLDTAHDAGVATAGAGRNGGEAQRPAVFPVPGRGRVLVFALAGESSGVPRSWSARGGSPGVNLLPDVSPRTARRVAAQVSDQRQAGDVVVCSIHWGSNWGYDIPADQQRFARTLIDAGGADIVHGHSSHHPRAVEVHGGRLILYGCGDFLNDYEGIRGYEAFRDDLVLMYLPGIRAGEGTLARLSMVPFRIANFRLHRASEEDTDWLAALLDRECRRYGAGIRRGKGILELEWE